MGLDTSYTFIPSHNSFNSSTNGLDINILHLSSTRDYESQHKMFILHKQPWWDIVINHYYRPNKIVGVLEGIWVDAIHGYVE